MDQSESISHTPGKVVKIGISGKRKLLDSTGVKKQICDAITGIKRNSGAQKIIGYSSIAIGSDSLFADIIKEKDELKIVLPFASEEYLNDFKDNDEDVQHYKQLLSETPPSSIITVKKNTPANQQERDSAYLAAGIYIADNVDYMIIVWDGLKPAGEGGTAEILGYVTKTKEKEQLYLIEVLPIKPDDIQNRLVSLLNDSDSRAIIYKKNHEAIWMASIILGVSAALVFAMYISFHPPAKVELGLATLEILLFITIIILILRAQKKKYHTQLIDERLRAEKLRLLEVYYHAGYDIDISKITEKTDRQLADLAEESNTSSKKTFHSVLYAWYNIEKLIDGQVSYHNKNINKKIGNKPYWSKVIGNSVYALFLSVLIIHVGTLFCEEFHRTPPIPWHYDHEWSTFLSIFLPPLYGGLMGWAHFKEWHEASKQSKKMLSFMKEQKNELVNANSMDELSEILDTVSANMLADNKRWNMVMLTNVTPHPVL